MRAGSTTSRYVAGVRRSAARLRAAGLRAIRRDGRSPAAAPPVPEPVPEPAAEPLPPQASRPAAEPLPPQASQSPAETRPPPALQPPQAPQPPATLPPQAPQPLLSALGRLADVVTVGWVLAGLYLYVFGWTYATALLNAWGVTPEDIGYDSLWLVARTALVFAVFLGFAFAVRAFLGGVRGDDAWAFALSWGLLATALARTSYSVVDINVVLVVAGSIALAAPFAAAADRLAGGDGTVRGSRWPIVALSVASLLYLSVYAGRLGEDYRAESTNGPVVIVFFPFKFVPAEWLNLVKIEFPLVDVSSAAGDDLGCGLLLRTHDGVHYVYDRDSVYRFPVDGFVVRDLRFDYAGHCDALDLYPGKDEAPPEPAPGATPTPTPGASPAATATTTPPPG